jgi:hypothetical protein
MVGWLSVDLDLWQSRTSGQEGVTKETAYLILARKQRERKKKGPDPQFSLQGLIPSDLTSPTRPDLIKVLPGPNST